MKNIKYILLLISGICAAQNKFVVKDGSKKYSVEISVANCSAGNCEGKATIKLIDKKSNRFFQMLTSADLYFFLDKKQKPTVNVVELYGEQSPLIFDDFNFDGTEDLAIRNGNKSGYGGPSYDVYVYNSTKKKFVLSNQLTNLTTDNLGMFTTDHKRKRLTAYSKSGCCWHMTTEYAVVANKGLRKVFELEEDAMNGDFVKVTTRNFIKNKWQIKTKNYKISEYYKE
ncbi:XAC2610-related protein [Flavobacterium procerum]|uniref:XAC2610-related protein n=1 Tax=Flavobacterium procerum TaxID=1455569 RepID=A0ABV6BT33_9FLAO